MAHAQKRTSPFKSAGSSVRSTTGSRGVRISGSNAEYTMFRGSVKDTGYPLHSPVSPSLPSPCFTVCHHISAEVYMSFGVCDWLRVYFVHQFMLLIGLVLHNAAKSTSARVIIGRFC